MEVQVNALVRLRLVTLAMVVIPVLLLIAERPAVQGAAPPEKPIDCRVDETRRESITVGYKVGDFLFQVGPEVTFGKEQGITWERVVQGLITRYVGVCNTYNEGLVTKAEYEERIGEIKEIYQEARKLEGKLIMATHARSKKAYDELESLVEGRTRAADLEEVALKDSLGILSRRIDQLEPVGRHLKPKVPCQTPDMLGMPGRSC